MSNETGDGDHVSLRPPECVNIVEESTTRDHLSHSSLGKLLACPERFRLHYEERLRPTVVATPLTLGRAFANALQSGSPDLAYNLVLSDWESEAEAAAGNPWLSVPTQEAAEVGATIAREAARCYLDRYGCASEMRELEMRVRIRNPEGRLSLTHDLLGRVDAVDIEHGVLIEDKLSGSLMRSSLHQRVRLDRQVSIGCYLVWRTTGEMIREVRYRVTLKPAIRKRQGEHHENFLKRIAYEYRSRPDHYLTEEIASRTQDDFLRLEHELWTWADAIRHSRRGGVWPRNTAACLDYGGCVYLPL